MCSREKKHHMCVRYLFSYNLLGIASTNYDDAQCPLHNIITSMLSVNHWSREDKFKSNLRIYAKIIDKHFLENLCKVYWQVFLNKLASCVARMWNYCHLTFKTEMKTNFCLSPKCEVYLICTRTPCLQKKV